MGESPVKNTMKGRIVLIGFRGAGKSTIARRLAAQLGWKVISTDDLIEKDNRMTIKEIVQKYGWPRFRELEGKVVETLRGIDRVVVDSGGGVVENPDLMNHLLTDSFVVWIDANIDDLVERLIEQNDRPLLNRRNIEEDIRENYLRRIPLYEKYSDIKINTSEMLKEEICEKILNKLKLK